MFKWLIPFLLLASPAWAQNPTCPTRPIGDSSNACASTAFVQQNAGSITGLTPNLPVIGSGSGGLAQGTRQGNTTSFATTNGAFTNGNCRSTDSNGNEVDSGGACGGGGGSGTVNTGQAGQLGGYATTGTAVSGVANGMITVATEAALAALAPGLVSTVHMQGYAFAGDGGEGDFNWQSSCPATPDAGVYVAPGAGGGGCWYRETFGQDPNIRWWGAHCNGTTDDSAIITKAIAFMATNPGGTLYWPSGCNEGTASTIVQPYSNVVIAAKGNGWSAALGNSPACAGTLTAISSFSSNSNAYQGAMLVIGPPSTAVGSTFALSGVGLRGLCINANNYANIGLLVGSQFSGNYSDIFVTTAKEYGIVLATTQTYNGGAALASNANIQWTKWTNIQVYEGVTSNAIPLITEGYCPSGGGGCVTGSNPSFDTFENIKLVADNTYAYFDAGSDNLTFITLIAYINNPSGLESVGLACSNLGPVGSPGGGSFCGGTHQFFHLSANGSASAVIGTGITQVQFWALDQGNGTTAPFCQSGTAHGSWQFSGGTTFGSC